MYIVDYERGEHDSFMVVDLNDALILSTSPR